MVVALEWEKVASLTFTRHKQSKMKIANVVAFNSDFVSHAVIILIQHEMLIFSLAEAIVKRIQIKDENG